MKSSIIALIVLGVVLDILVWRRRHLGYLIIYYELVNILSQAIVPFDFGTFEGIMLIMLMVQTFITVACAPAQNIIACTVTVLICEFGAFPLVYQN